MMDFANTPKHRMCPKTGVNVRVDQSEQQCRSQQGCRQKHCPLGSEFARHELEIWLTKFGLNRILTR